MKRLSAYFKNSSGFTLVELLVVIGILGVLAAVLIALIDPVDKLNAANDTGVINTIAQLATGEESYAANHNGFFAATAADMVTTGDLRTSPTAPTGYAYTWTLTPSACASGTTCTSVVITSPLKSKKYVGATPSTPFYRYETSTGKKCPVATIASACP